MSKKQDSELGKMLETYRKVSIVLNSFPIEEKISVKDLAERANVHWNTAKKALLFFGMLNQLVPRFRMESSSKFRVVKKPSAVEVVDGVFESSEMRILVKLMLRNAIDERTAQKIVQFSARDNQVLQELISKGFVNSLEGRFYLSKRGQSLASIGIKRLVDLGIELPWDKTQTLTTLPERTIERDHSLWFQGRTRRDINAPKRIFRGWQTSRDYQGWQTSRDNRRKELCYA